MLEQVQYMYEVKATCRNGTRGQLKTVYIMEDGMLSEMFSPAGLL